LQLIERGYPILFAMNSIAMKGRKLSGAAGVSVVDVRVRSEAFQGIGGIRCGICRWRPAGLELLLLLLLSVITGAAKAVSQALLLLSL
jgi:hypothetical protein